MFTKVVLLGSFRKENRIPAVVLFNLDSDFLFYELFKHGKYSNIFKGQHTIHVYINTGSMTILPWKKWT